MVVLRLELSPKAVNVQDLYRSVSNRKPRALVYGVGMITEFIEKIQYISLGNLFKIEKNNLSNYWSQAKDMLFFS